MTLFKSLLLGSAVGFVAVASAQAADLPSKKAAPATYVKICDAYGAGFFFIPGTDTCVKVGGRVRYDAAYAPKGDYYGNATTATSYADYTKEAYAVSTKDGSTLTYTTTPAVQAGTATAGKFTAPAAYTDNGKKSAIPQDVYGQHIRGQITLDARTATDMGVARTFMTLRLSQSTGLLGGKSSPFGAVGADDLAGFASSGPTIERAFIQFAGFTVGRASSIFAAGPSLSFGSNSHFTSFANGTLQASYTAVLGGGFSATVGIEDPKDHGSANAALKFEAPFAQPYDTLPVIVGNIAWDQSWGRIQVSGAMGRNRSQQLAGQYTATNTDYNITKNSFAYAGFLTLNADMITKGDKFFLLGGYSDGNNSLGFKDASNASSNNARDIDGIAQSYKSFTCLTSPTSGIGSGSTAVNTFGTECQNTKSTWLSAAYTHNWTAKIRQNVMAGVAYVDPGSIARASSAATQKATFSAIGTNLIWTPVKDFDIGVEVLYNRSSVGNDTATGAIVAGELTGGLNTLNSQGALGCNAASAVAGCRSSGSMLMSRIRIERTF